MPDLELTLRTVRHKTLSHGRRTVRTARQRGGQRRITLGETSTRRNGSPGRACEWPIIVG
jgi:hypothetical protein